MKSLLAGCESAERFELLIKLTKIKSEGILNALEDHLVRGFTEDLASIKNGVPQSNFNRALSSLDAANEIVEKIKALDWAHINNKSVK